jgi:hypothetical protein
MSFDDIINGIDKAFENDKPKADKTANTETVKKNQDSAQGWKLDDIWEIDDTDDMWKTVPDQTEEN